MSPGETNGLGRTQLAVLEVLASEPGLSYAQLASHFDLTERRVRDAVARLVDRELVFTTKDPGNPGRVWRSDQLGLAARRSTAIGTVRASTDRARRQQRIMGQLPLYCVWCEACGHENRVYAWSAMAPPKRSRRGRKARSGTDTDGWL